MNFLQETFPLTKYILRNILGRKNIQVLKLDIIEQCYKREISTKHYAENVKCENKF